MATVNYTIQVADGAVATPGMSFYQETGSGLYRIGASNVGFAIAGVKVVDVAAAGVAVVGTLSSSGAATLASLAVTGATTLNGNVTIGDATGDALTFHPSAWTLTNAVTVTGTWANLGTVAAATSITATAFSGPLNGTVGAVTPASVAATTGAFSGVATFNSAVKCVAAVGAAVDVAYYRTTTARWDWSMNTADETGSGNAGSNLNLYSYNDAGSALGTPISITRATGAVAFGGVASFAAGAVDAPSLACTGDLNTGFWFPADNTIAASVNGVEGLRLTTTGLTVASLAGVGTRTVVVDANGVLSAP